MGDFIRAIQYNTNLTNTENGAAAFQSTLNANLDAFGLLGGMMHYGEDEIIPVFSRAFSENRELAMRLLFYMRDIRGGQGCRRLFRVIFKWLAENFPEYVVNNLDNVLVYGRGDDLLCLLDTDVKDNVILMIKRQLHADEVACIDGEPCSLLAKWLPSANTSSKATRRYANIIIQGLGWTPRRYRTTLSLLRQYIGVTEVEMSANQWDAINYEQVPSKAAMRYSNAFYRHDKAGYTKYIQDLAEGKVKANAGALYPADIVGRVLNAPLRGKISAKDRILLDAQWRALPDYFAGREETGICMVDTSGSMSGIPYLVAVSLGIYCADKCKGPFHNHFITFAEKPEFRTLVGETIVEKVQNLRTINAWNTDIEAAFGLILQAAIDGHCAQDEIPSKLYIISDMQFDQARCGWDHRGQKPAPFMQEMKQKFADAGYQMPAIVYWNVRSSDCGMFQETFEGENCAMVSGYSPSLFESVIKGTVYEETVQEDGSVKREARIDPMTVMINTLMDARYDRVYTGA